MADYGSYIFGWLVGYSGVSRPIAGVLICDKLRRAAKQFPDRRRSLTSGMASDEYSRGFNGRPSRLWPREQE